MSADRFTEFGDTEIISLTKIQQLTGTHLSRNWASIPHVTHHDDADVTLLAASRQQRAPAYADRKITLMAFYVKAIAAALRKFPRFNSSLDESGQSLILKKYVNVGVAVDTPKGLVVPVIRQVDEKSLADVALEIQTLAQDARSKGLGITQMTGGCITISSLGRNGGTSFTPIINAPEVAILGISGLQERPVRTDAGIAWRIFSPLSLSYDHRVINGVEAAAFVRGLSTLLADPAGDWAQ
jgi:pyruvate dehydrogenase E2 component (dihydrolipoamide acetyltransferase)